VKPVDDGRDRSAVAAIVPAMEPMRLARLAKSQLGLFTRGQAMACGFTSGQIRRRVAGGTWRPVQLTVLADASLRLTRSMQDRAAQLAVPGSVLGGPSAGRVWDMPVPDLGPALVLGRKTRLRPHGAVIIRDRLDRRDVQVFEGAAITSRERTVFDCLRLLPERDGVKLLDTALLRGWTNLDDLTGRVRAHAGRWGAPALVGLIRSVAGGARSAAERRLGDLLRRAGIVGWTANADITDEQGPIGVGDVVFRAARIVIEVDGWAYHSDPELFQRDRTRQNRLVRAGWMVLRFTWRDLTKRPDHVVSIIRTVTGQRG
jgi:very-short-patch-repair endonuclease